MKLAVLLLCHEAPAKIAARLSSPFFTDPDLKVYLHYDARRGDADLRALEALIPPGVNHAFVKDRLRCRWGSPELVIAAQRMMRDALSDGDFEPDYLALISASCTPIRPFSSLREFLVRRNGQEFIQAKDISKGQWVRGGLERERYLYYFPFDYLTQKRWFDRAINLQRRIRLRRQPPPSSLRVHFGSQWFCITRQTARHVVEQLGTPEMRRFLKWSWIADEFAIQTLVANHVKPHLIADATLTYYEFTTDGIPLVLQNGHLEHLMRQPFFFARKIAPDADRLTAQLSEYVRTAEYDLSYFDHVGVPTSDFQKFEAEVLATRKRRAHVGTIEDQWRGVSDLNDRPYYVLFSASRSYVRQIAAAARQSAPVPVFDYLFDPRALVPAGERPSYRGIQVGDIQRRDYDPSTFLYEVANVDPAAAAAFAVDPAHGGWITQFILWDANATLVHCEPDWATPKQRAEAACRDLEGGRDAKLIAATLDALWKKQPLPQDAFLNARKEGKHHCRFLQLRAIPLDARDPTLRALRAAGTMVDATKHYGPQ